MTGPNETLTYLLPEIIVAVTGMVVLLADMINPAEAAKKQGPRPWIAHLAIAGLLAAVVPTLMLAGQRVTLFDGVILLDPLATFFKLLFIGIAVLVLLMSVDPLPKFSRWPAEFHALIVWCTLGHMVLAAAGELFTVFLALQLTSLPLIVLIAYAKSDPLSGEASLKYLLLVLVSTAVLLYGMTLIYGALGTSTISEIAKSLSGQAVLTPVVALGLVLLVTGFAFKITAVPFHYWVPDVYQGAPSPVTAFLSVGSKFAGFALALRIIVSGLKVPLDWHLIFGVMAVLSMTLGNLGAIRQKNLKRMLAYSGIAQAGYLLIGLAALSENGITSLLFYTVAYGLANLAAFGVIIVFANASGSEDIVDYRGLSRRSPLAALALAIALLSLGGLPLMAGFMAKFYVFLYAAEAGLVWLEVVGVVNSVIALYYYLNVVWAIYVPEGDKSAVDLTPRASVAMSLCIAGVLALGVFPEPMLQAARHAASTLF
jgi:NADH-quinone oxidoreductase subunit N